MNIPNLLNKILIIFILVFTPYLVNYVSSVKKEDYLVFLNIGQGDSTLVCDHLSNCGLIDTGKQNNVIKEIRMYTNKPLEFILLTHPDLDHTAKAIEILDQIGSKQVFLANTKKARELIEKITSLGIPVYELRSNNDFDFGKYKFDIIWPQSNTDLETIESNETSTTIHLSNQSKTFFWQEIWVIN